MSTTEIVSVDGAITPTAEAVIPLRDDGLYRGDGVFEVARLYGGRPYGLDEHLDRLERSAAQIELPIERGPLEAEIGSLLQAHGDGDGQLRIVITRGGRRIAAIEELPNLAPSVSLASVSYSPTIILTGAKTLSYAANMQATRLAVARGGDEAVLVRPDGIVLEPPTSTIFWVSPDGELRTPALERGVLDSITRDRLVKVLPVEEGHWRVEELRAASEAFLASTTREIQAVSAIDATELPIAPGPRTREAQEAFAATLGQEL